MCDFSRQKFSEEKILFYFLMQKIKLYIYLFFSVEGELQELKMEVKISKDAEVDEVSKLKSQLAQAEKKYDDELKKKAAENSQLLHR